MAQTPLPRQSGNPILSVHLCFFAVFLFSAFLTVHEALELKTSYEDRQRAQLAEIQKNLDSQFQESVDELVYYQKMLSYALTHPLDSDNAREAVTRFQALRQHPLWQLQLNSPRSMPLNGVGDAWLARDPLLRRDPALIDQEIRAALEFSFIMQFSDPDHDFHSRFWYISRAGFYISSRPPQSPQELEQSYATMVQRAYFRALNPQQNPSPYLRWTSGYQGQFDEGLMLTLSAPIISNGYWYGVLSMDFPQARIRNLLAETRHTLLQGNLVFLDRKLEEVARLHAPDEVPLNAEQRQELLKRMQHERSGILRLGTQFASWSKLENVDGYIINVQTLKQGMKQELGRVTLFLLGMWLLFVLMLAVAHQVIFRLVRRQDELSARLTWRANYDGLTRLLNRSAFFEQFVAQAAHCQQLQRPLAVIQLDVDHFKKVNDTWGHHAGDQALIRVASVISHTLRKYDVAGRIGGEEFCIVLPETTLAEASVVAERIRARLAAKTILVNASTTFNITLSAGVTSSEEQGDYDAESLQAKADSRLYLAKTSGRNRVCSAD
ncbi:cellulose biosynthesis regulator diguanylate cyclase DgcQ [Pantoea phytobeneficialis]|uniref:diguanylate cyclase n=1 Tax=Pantoea phytobeneficialis TaxID=2052056 RepID=A0AAP9H715_9GAMM|nr:cellulose biosynthesis regulator diguanylate cyclase DgcQ [Pantoea phytobeneficialis]MDO6408843.1 cellulose biosynthesis regulator diguanylate cyclase DgcQ [Pantoea phytobeneficialis]QGR07955.1 cellulose biosynthesis regulator YedQ [Pantoea phytobeneficialis]